MMVNYHSTSRAGHLKAHQSRRIIQDIPECILMDRQTRRFHTVLNLSLRVTMTEVDLRIINEICIPKGREDPDPLKPLRALTHDMGMDPTTVAELEAQCGGFVDRSRQIYWAIDRYRLSYMDYDKRKADLDRRITRRAAYRPGR